MASDCDHTHALTAIEPCAACGSADLELHMRVAGGVGEAGLAPTTDEFGRALSDIAHCLSCGHMQLESLPSEAQLAAAYAAASSGEYLEEERGQRETARRLLDRVERHVTPGTLLDVGCWAGFLLAEARERGWDPLVGVEPSEFASRYARERFGLDVRTGGLEDVELDQGAFRAAFMGDVIEHLPDPAAALDRVAALLEPEGVLALALPDAGSRVARILGRRWWSVVPTHVQYFTRHSLALLLRRHGYQLLDLGTAPKVFTVRYYLGRIGGYSPRLARALVGASERVRLADRAWAPDFGDRMLAIARAPGASGGGAA